MNGFRVILSVCCFLIIRHYLSLASLKAERRMLNEAGAKPALQYYQGMKALQYYQEMNQAVECDPSPDQGFSWVVSNNLENSLSVWDD